MEAPDRSEDPMVMSNIPLSSRNKAVTPYTYLFGPESKETADDTVDIGMSYVAPPIGRMAAEPTKEEKFASEFGKVGAVFGFIGILFYVFDVGSDIQMAVMYFIGGELLYGSVTLVLIVVPSLVICVLGLIWYAVDYDKEQKALDEAKRDEDPSMLGKVKELLTPAYLWPIRVIVTLLQFGMVFRIYEYLKSGRKFMETKGPKKKVYYWRVMCQDVNVCLLQLFESFLESSPQLTWQLYVWITLKPEEDVVGLSGRVIGLLSSWISPTMSLMLYHRAIRFSRARDGFKPMTFRSIPFYLIWRACELGTRVLCISLFASSFQASVLVPVGVHWFLISAWLMCQEVKFYEKNPRLDKVFDVICGFAMIFCFLNPKKGHSRFRCLLFYILFYVENVAMLTVWFLYPTNVAEWFHVGGFIAILALAFLHVLFLLLYYMCFHPSDEDINYCLSWNEVTLYKLIC
ncbi:XK-related protein 6-like [Haliotis rufescens]|uniref:XK-related protein 6-like n=1 Tax=Haliotis rufescens TaxID=6454 RepID=UPI00201EE24C|nr:XK-related protein 6-like [Haliotis rufescens]